MRVEGLQIPSRLAERSRQILKYGDPSILATANQIRSAVLTLKHVLGDLQEIQIKDEQGPLTIGCFKHRKRIVSWVQFGPYGSDLPTFAMSRRGDRVRVFNPNFDGYKIVMGTPVGFDRNLRRRVLEAISSEVIINVV